MDSFLKWFFAFVSEILQGFAQIFVGFWNGIVQIFNIKKYIEIFKEYSTNFGVLEWILSILAIIIIIAIFLLIIGIIVLAVRKYLRFRHSIVSNEDLLEEISVLQQRVIRMVKEKDEIMAMKVAQIGVPGSASLSLASAGGGTFSAGEGAEGEGGEGKALEGAAIPEYKTAGAAGADVCALVESPVELNPGDRALIGTGLFFAIPDGYEIQVRPRSGLAAKNGVTVLNTPGTIDSDYRGELKVILINLGKEKFTVNPGDRIAQIIVAPVTRGRFVVVEELDQTERGLKTNAVPAALVPQESDGHSRNSPGNA